MHDNQHPDELYAWMADGEGILAFLGNDGTWMPAVVSSPELARKLEPRVQLAVDATNTPARLYRFTRAGEELVLTPASSKAT